MPLPAHANPAAEELARTSPPPRVLEYYSPPRRIPFDERVARLKWRLAEFVIDAGGAMGVMLLAIGLFVMGGGVLWGSDWLNLIGWTFVVTFVQVAKRKRPSTW